MPGAVLPGFVKRAEFEGRHGGSVPTVAVAGADLRDGSGAYEVWGVSTLVKQQPLIL